MRDGCAAPRRRRACSPRTGQRQIVETDIDEKAQPCIDLLQDLACDHLLRRGQRQRGQKRFNAAHRHVGKLGDVLPADGNAERFPFQPFAAAIRAGRFRHVLLDFLLAVIGVRLFIAAGHVDRDSLERRVKCSAAEFLLIGDVQTFFSGSVEDRLPHSFGQIAVGRVHRYAEVLAKRLEIHGGDRSVAAAVPAHHVDRALGEREGRIGNEQRRIDFFQRTETGACRTGAVGVVEGEHTRRKLFHVNTAVGAGIVLRKQHLLAAHDLYDRKVFAKAKRVFQRIRKTAAEIILDHETVDHGLDAMLELFVERGNLGKVIHLAVYAHANVSFTPQLVEHLLMLALAAADAGRHDLNARSIRKRHDAIDHLIDGLTLDDTAADGTVRRAAARVEQAQIVVDLRHRADGRTRIVARTLLVDGDRGGKTVDAVKVGFFHLSEEHAGVGGKAFDITPLPLGIDRVKGKTRFAAAGQTRKDHELVPRHNEVYIFEIVLSGTLNNNILHGVEISFLPIARENSGGAAAFHIIGENVPVRAATRENNTKNSLFMPYPVKAETLYQKHFKRKRGEMRYAETFIYLVEEAGRELRPHILAASSPNAAVS